MLRMNHMGQPKVQGLEHLPCVIWSKVQVHYVDTWFSSQTQTKPSVDQFQYPGGQWDKGSGNETSVHLDIIFTYITSGNRTPGSRFYSDLLGSSVCIHQLVLKRRNFKALGCSCNCRRLADGSFHDPINAHVTWWHTDKINIDLAIAAKTKAKHYYSAHNVATRVSFGM